MTQQVGLRFKHVTFYSHFSYASLCAFDLTHTQIKKHRIVSTKYLRPAAVVKRIHRRIFWCNIFIKLVTTNVALMFCWVYKGKKNDVLKLNS